MISQAWDIKREINTRIKDPSSKMKQFSEPFPVFYVIPLYDKYIALHCYQDGWMT